MDQQPSAAGDIAGDDVCAAAHQDGSGGKGQQPDDPANPIQTKIAQLRARMDQLNTERESAIKRSAQARVMVQHSAAAELGAAKWLDGELAGPHGAQQLIHRRDSISSIGSVQSVHSTRTDVFPLTRHMQAQNAHDTATRSNEAPATYQELEGSRKVSRRLSIMTEPGASSGFPALDEGFADMLKEMMGANKALVEVNSQLAVASERAAGFEDKLQKTEERQKSTEEELRSAQAKQAVLEAKLHAAQEARVELSEQLVHERSNTAAAMSAVTAVVTGLSPPISFVEFARRRMSVSAVQDTGTSDANGSRNLAAARGQTGTAQTPASTSQTPAAVNSKSRRNAAIDDVPGQRFKTKICSYHAKGNCSHGASCSFAHGVAELQVQPAHDGPAAASIIRRRPVAPIVAEAKPLKGLKMGRCKRILIDGGERAVDVDVQRVGQDLLLVICDPSTGAELTLPQRVWPFMRDFITSARADGSNAKPAQSSTPQENVVEKQHGQQRIQVTELGTSERLRATGVHDSPTSPRKQTKKGSGRRKSGSSKASSQAGAATASTPRNKSSRCIIRFGESGQAVVSEHQGL